MLKRLNEKKLIIFDLDGTLTESKADLDAETSRLLCGLLAKKMVAVIGGGSFSQFKKQLLTHLSCHTESLSRLFLFPTSGACFYTHENNVWRLAYAHNFTPEEKQKILNAFETVSQKSFYQRPARIYGEIVEDRGTQITFSALGQSAPLREKERWNKDSDTRMEIKKVLERYIPEFEIRLGGLTSIDVTRKGIDKAYGIRQIEKFLKVSKTDMLFIGDALYEGGNDYPVMSEGVSAISISGLKDTKKLIQSIVSVKTP